MIKIPTPSCPKCGDDMTLVYRKSSGMDIEPTGLRATCMRCGFEMGVKSLDNEDNKMLAGLKS